MVDEKSNATQSNSEEVVLQQQSSKFKDSVETPDTPISGSSILLSQPLIPFDEINLKEKVGHGSYGVVYKAEWRNRFVAVKEFGASAEQKAIETEVKQLSRVQHDNIIALFGLSINQQLKYLIMEYAEGGSLHNFLHGKVKPYYSTAHAMSWARQCAEGVAYLHAMKPKPLIHRDLKPLNLLLTNKGRHLKICDFGTVVDKSTLMTNSRGSAAWMAPEVFESSKYTEKCDIFSWAIVLWEVLSRQQPFKEIDNTLSIMWKIHKGDRPPIAENYPPIIKQLMTSCWATKPDVRPSMQHVVKIMNELAESFPGADEPLEYEFVNQQIICANSNTTDEDKNYSLDFGSFVASSISHTSSSQVTPTNSNTSTRTTPTPTNMPDLFNQQTNNVPTASITASTRWDVIPEEGSTIDFDLTPSPFAAKRYATIRNGMPNVPMPPLSVQVDPENWDFNGNKGGAGNAKGDGKEHLTVSDNHPLLPANSTIMSSNAITKNMDESDLNLNADNDDDEDNDVNDQSLTGMLDPEFQPEEPIPGNPESEKIYREHRQLAKDYLRVDTKIYYAQEFKEKILLEMDPAEQQEKKEYLKKMSERDELIELYNNLQKQIESLRSNQPEVVSDDGWVVVAPNQNT